MTGTRKWGGRAAVKLTRQTLSEYGDVCHICGNAGANSADHILPRSLGGSDDIANLRPAHSRCNSARGNRITKAKRRGADLSGFFLTTDAPDPTLTTDPTPADDEQHDEDEQ